MICRGLLALLLLAYVGAILLWAAGTFGWFAAERDPLAGVFLIPLGVPWTYAAGFLPDGVIRIGGALLAPLVNLALLRELCRWTHKTG